MRQQPPAPAPADGRPKSPSDKPPAKGPEDAQSSPNQPVRAQPEAPPPPGEPAGTGVLRVPGAAPRDVPLMSIQRGREEARVEVGPITPETGVADVLLGSLGLVAVMVIASLILGAIVGGVLIFLKHRLGFGGPDKDAEDHVSVTR